MRASLSFASAEDLRKWLLDHHAASEELWLRIYKADSGVPSVTYAEALDQALCFGWIDGQKKPLDDESWLQRFTPRKPKSKWSQRNTEHAERLIAAGQMTEAGMREVDAAKADGRWETAYTAFASATFPEDFLAEVALHPEVNAFLKTLNRTNQYSIIYRLETAKTAETRQRRIRQIIEKLERGEKYH